MDDLGKNYDRRFDPPDEVEEKASLEEIARELLLHYLNRDTELIFKLHYNAISWNFFEDNEKFINERDKIAEEIYDLNSFLSGGKVLGIDKLEKVQEDIQSGKITLNDVRECGWDY